MFCNNNLEMKSENILKEKQKKGITKKRPAEPESNAPDDVKTDIEGVISDYEKGNYGDQFITVEKKQIRVPNPKFLNSEIKTEPKPVRGQNKKTRKKNN